MLELFAVRGQLAVTILVHATLAASTWVASLHAADRVRTGAAPDTSWQRVRLLAPLTALSGLLVAVQLGVHWRPTFAVGGAALGLPVAVAVVASIARGLVARRTPSASAPAAYTVLGLGALSGVMSLAALAWLGHPWTADIAAEGSLTASPIAALVSPTGWIRVAHFGLAATMLGATFLAVGSTRRADLPTLQWSAKAALLALSLQAVVGLASVRNTGHHEPAKLAAMAAQFPTMARAPVQLGAWPYDFGEKTTPGVALSGALSTIVHGDPSAEVEGLLATNMEDRPPVAALYVSMQVKALTGLLAWFALLGVTIAAGRGRSPRYTLMLVGVPLAFLTWTLLWFVTELGRSPWTIRGALRVGEATWLPAGIAPAAIGWVLVSLALAGVAIAGCRRIPSPGETSEPVPTGNV